MRRLGGCEHPTRKRNGASATQVFTLPVYPASGTRHRPSIRQDSDGAFRVRPPFWFGRMAPILRLNEKNTVKTCYWRGLLIPFIHFLIPGPGREHVESIGPARSPAKGPVRADHGGPRNGEGLLAGL